MFKIHNRAELFQRFDSAPDRFVSEKARLIKSFSYLREDRLLSIRDERLVPLDFVVHQF